MKITLNPDAQMVAAVREGLAHTGGYCPCRRERKPEINVFVRSSVARWRIRTLKATVIACCTTARIGTSL